MKFVKTRPMAMLSVLLVKNDMLRSFGSYLIMMPVWILLAASMAVRHS